MGCSRLHLYMHQYKVIVHMERQSENIFKIPYDKNILTCQSYDTIWCPLLPSFPVLLHEYLPEQVLIYATSTSTFTKICKHHDHRENSTAASRARSCTITSTEYQYLEGMLHISWAVPGAWSHLTVWSTSTSLILPSVKLIYKFISPKGRR